MINKKERVNIDVIILSYAETPELKAITENCITSLMASEDPTLIEFNIVIIESQKEMNLEQYQYGITVYPDQKFGYHTYMNIGVNMTSSAFVCLCNNDLLFHKGWAMEILKAFNDDAELYSASPICSFHHPFRGFQLNSGVYTGYRMRGELSGWCIFLKRDVFKIIGKLDENYEFWYADNDYANTLSVLNLKHVLVSSSIVDHLEEKTLHNQSEDRQLELTKKGRSYYDKKWRHRHKVISEF